MPHKKSTIQYWTQIVEKWQTSGLSQRDFCKLESVNVNTFNSWKLKIADKKDSKQNKSEKGAFVKAMIKRPIYQIVSIELPNQVKLSIQVQEEDLTQLMKRVSAL